MINLEQLEQGKIYPIIVRTEFRFFHLRSWISLMIRLRYKSWANHGAMLYKYRGNVWVYESDSRGIFPVLYKNWKRKNDKIKILELRERLNSYDNMINKVGKRYDFFSLFRHLGNWFGWKKSKNPGKRMTCYEYVAFVYELPNWWKARPIDFER